MRDYTETVRALRAKAADPSIPREEAKLFSDKADEIERNHFNSGTDSASIPFAKSTLDMEKLRKLWDDHPWSSDPWNSPDLDDLIPEEYRYGDDEP